MKIIYHCFGGTHSSIVAAALHLGWLPREHLPSAAEIQAIPYFDQRRRGEEGEIKFLGRDSYGHEIYAVGKRGMGTLLENFLYDLAEALKLPRGELLLLDTTPLVNCWMALGGFLSRRLGLTFLGRPLVTWGVKRAYPSLVSLVETLSPLRVSSFPVELSPREKPSRLLIFTSSRTLALALAAATLYLRVSAGSPLEYLDEYPRENTFWKKKPGQLLFVGEDPYGLKVYATAIGPYFNLLHQIVEGFLSLWGLDKDSVRLIKVDRYASPLTHLGSLLHLPWVFHWGLRRSYSHFSKLISEVKLDAGSKISDNGSEK
ncbi:Protein of unknown function [Thermanaeromonas toyohensis ToBE]|uniref:DUF3189 domain-containing protein n=2 Tax=Thermanaeromonas TaxID=202949 RepID=A0A1W1VY49_9FIRM|nr:Protein of unknown function [Thermanaeromonas toyohensis ToBE]